MAFNRPTLSELQERIVTDLETRLGIRNAGLRNGPLKLIAFVLAGVAHLLYGFLDWISKQSFPATASSEYLDRIASQWGLSREAATYAEGEVEFTGQNATLIPEETELVSSDGMRFKTTEEVTVAAGVATAGVRALTAGTGGNADEGTILSLLTPISGLESEAEVSTEITGGVDEESDADLQERISERVQAPPLGGAIADYEKWAKEVAGVTRAWAYSRYLGPGTVGIFFMKDDDEDPYPSQSEVEGVSAYIEEKKPVTADHYVFAPTADEVNFTINLTPDTAEVRAQVELELADLIERSAEPGGIIYLSHMREAISLAAGETDHTLVTPSANFESENGYIPEMGTITWL